MARIVAGIATLLVSADIAIAQPAAGLPPQAAQQARDNAQRQNQGNQNHRDQPPAVPYTQDFQQQVGQEWSTNHTASLPRTSTFLGPFTAAQAPTLTLSTTAGTNYILFFDLLIFDHWEGLGRGAGNDEFRVSAGNTRLFSHQFSTGTHGPAFDPDTMWLATWENLGYSSTRDLWLRDVRVPFRATDATTVLTFLANLFADNAAESWAIDNVRVILAANEQPVAPGLHVEWFNAVPATSDADYATETSADLVSDERQIAWLPTSRTLNPAHGTDNIALRAYGGLIIPQTGSYDFRLTSDDGSMLRINNQLVINNNGLHSMRARTATIQLAQGTHTLDLRLHERTGTVGCILEWRRPGETSYSVIPPDAFTHLGSPAPVTFTNISASSGLSNISGLGVIALLTADFDNDGYQDIVFSGLQPSIAFGSSTSRFTASRINSFFYYQHTLGDVDNDGLLDFWSGLSGLVHNTGSRRFTLRQFPGSPTQNAYSIAMTDFDADGHLDLATTWSNLFTPSRNLGPESIATPVEFDAAALDDLFLNASLTANAGNFFPIDFNADGRTDLLHASARTGILLHTATDDGYTTSRLLNPTANSDWILASINPADSRNSGNLDILYSLRETGTANGFLRNNAGTLTNSTSSLPRFSDFRWIGGDWGDVDNDGDLDLLVWSFYDARVRLYLNNGDGTFTPRITIPASPQYPADARFVDIDNDGDLDIIITSFLSTPVLWQNDLDDARSLAVRLVGAGAGATNTAAIGTRVTIHDAHTETFIARRDVTSNRGVNGAGPLWLHFGGLDPTREYIVTAHFLSGPIQITTTPDAASTTIATTTIRRMLTIEEPAPSTGRRVARWQHANQEATILAALRAECRRRGLLDQLRTLTDADQDNRQNLMRLLGARTLRDALGDDARILRDLSQAPNE